MLLDNTWFYISDEWFNITPLIHRYFVAHLKRYDIIHTPLWLIFHHCLFSSSHLLYRYILESFTLGRTININIKILGIVVFNSVNIRWRSEGYHMGSFGTIARLDGVYISIVILGWCSSVESYYYSEYSGQNNGYIPDFESTIRWCNFYY